MRISAISEVLNSEIKKNESAKKTENASQSKTIQVDKTELSIKGKRLNETKAHIDVVSSKIANEPDIRPEKVTEVREKINSGYYDSEEFIDKLANKLLKDFNIK